MWAEGIAAINKYLADEVRGELWYGHADMTTGKRTATTSGALDAFFPAVLALSGDLTRAKRLQDSSFKMWTKHNIEPEEFDYQKMEVGDPSYHLRPEIVESTLYLYHYTTDREIFANGKNLLRGFCKILQNRRGLRRFESVVTKEKSDTSIRFLFAETFKFTIYCFAAENSGFQKRFQHRSASDEKDLVIFLKMAAKNKNISKNRKENFNYGRNGFSRNPHCPPIS